MQEESKPPIKAIIGLGNPGKKYYFNRHSIGFRVVDELVQYYGGTWQERDYIACADIVIDGHALRVIKPLTYMNASGKVIPFLLKKGIGAENLLVVHDELELPFGKIALKKGGSHRGHNGLRSIIGVCGPDFYRLRIGIGRPDNREDVPAYVLEDFKQSKAEVDAVIAKAVDAIGTCRAA